MTKSINNIFSSLLTGQSSEHICWLETHIGIHKQVKKPWQALQLSARKAGFELKIASGFRSFERQLMLWNKKFLQQVIVKDKKNNPVDFQQITDDDKVIAILLFSALPGASRHHWGTDLDLYASNLLPPNKLLQLEPWEYQQEGYFAGLTQWLAEHAIEYGFFQPYNIDRGGVAIEPWHFSYAPLADLYQQQLSPELLKETLQNVDICGKKSILKQLTNIYQRYIMNVNHVKTLDNHFD